MKRRQQGFTLIEVMVAIMLMAIVSLIAWRGLDSVSRADQHLKSSSEQTEALLRALGQLERDVSLRAGVELKEPGVPEAENNRAPAAVNVRSSDRKGLDLEIIRTAAALEGGLQRVRWWVKGDTLYRAVGAARSQYPLPKPGEGVAVLGQVQKVEVRVWQGDKGWRRLSGNRQDNPQGLEISLTRQTPQGIEQYRQVLGPL